MKILIFVVGVFCIANALLLSFYNEPCITSIPGGATLIILATLMVAMLLGFYAPIYIGEMIYTWSFDHARAERLVRATCRAIAYAVSVWGVFLGYFVGTTLAWLAVLECGVLLLAMTAASAMMFGGAVASTWNHWIRTSVGIALVLATYVGVRFYQVAYAQPFTIWSALVLALVTLVGCVVVPKEQGWHERGNQMRCSSG